MFSSSGEKSLDGITMNSLVSRMLDMDTSSRMNITDNFDDVSSHLVVQLDPIYPSNYTISNLDSSGDKKNLIVKELDSNPEASQESILKKKKTLSSNKSNEAQSQLVEIHNLTLNRSEKYVGNEKITSQAVQEQLRHQSDNSSKMGEINRKGSNLTSGKTVTNVSSHDHDQYTSGKLLTYYIRQ